ncbi:MAG: zinc-dependent metalloprotease family protein [Acidobacteriota bacterium]
MSALLATASAHGAEPLKRLFRKSETIAGTPSSVASVAEMRVEIDFGILPEASELEIKLFRGRKIVAQRMRLRQRSPDNFTWKGRLIGRGRKTGRILLAAKDGALSGVLFTSDAVFQIVPLAGGEHRLVLLNQGLFPGCDGALAPSSDEPETSAATSEGSATDSASRQDVMVLYTTQARLGAGGAAQIEATIQNAVDITNSAYANSQVEPRLNLIHMEEVAYGDSGILSSDLYWLKGDAGVAALRDIYGADMVGLIVNDGTACGSAFLQNNPGAAFESKAFMVTVRDCAVGNLTFAHEFAHNQGCDHNPENSPSFPNHGSFPWSFGHWHDGNYRTVLSYSAPCALGCTRQPYFSNSNVIFNGLPTGILDERENYRTINDTAIYVANFREITTGCGNGRIDGTEECDGGDLGGATCATFGHLQGSMSCTFECTFDTTGCSTCGNNQREGDELCDTGDLGGLDCSSYGCTGSGSPACNTSCDGFDLSACTACPVCDNDGICESDEDCAWCGGDCVSGPGFLCGNGICEAGDGEDCLTCPVDCNGRQTAKLAERFCCGNGGRNPVGCNDARCEEGGLSCTAEPVAPHCCGDGIVESAEGDGSICDGNF